MKRGQAKRTGSKTGASEPGDAEKQGGEYCGTGEGVLYPDREQQLLIEKTFGCCRFVYNWFLDERIRTYRESGRTLSYNEQCIRLPAMKADPGTGYLKEADSTALQNSVRDLQEAFDGFFWGLKNGQRRGFPKFRRKHSGSQSYRSTCTNGNIRLTDRRYIRFPKGRNTTTRRYTERI